MTLVALPLVALERHASAWAIAAVLVAELAPVMLLGAWLGGLTDRWPRGRCLVGADVVRCAALAAIVVIPSLTAMVVLAALAGAATGVWRPAALTALPALGVGEDRATAVFGAVTTIGRTGGALLAGLLFALLGTEGVLAIDAVTFAASALLLAGVPLGRPAAREPTDAPAAGAAVRPPRLVAVAVASSAVALAAGVANVAEPIYVSVDLGAGAAGFALVLAAWGAGAGVGSMTAATSRGDEVIARRFLTAIGLTGLGFAIAAFAETLPVALAGFALNGVGNGAALSHERLLVRTLVPEEALGRAFGYVEAMASWAFAAALVGGGALVALTGAENTILLAGLATLLVAALIASPLRALGARPQASCPPTTMEFPPCPGAAVNRSPRGRASSPPAAATPTPPTAR
jgi:MFS family permease